MRCQDVFLPQDGELAVDQKPRSLIGVRDDALAENESLARLELDFQSHMVSVRYGVGVMVKSNS